MIRLLGMTSAFFHAFATPGPAMQADATDGAKLVTG